MARLDAPLWLALLLAVVAAPASPRDVDPEDDAEETLLPGRGPRTLTEAVGLWHREGRPRVVMFPGRSGGQPSPAVMDLLWFPSFNPADVKFHLFTKSDVFDIRGTQVELNKSSLLSAGWNQALPTKIVIHGFDDDITWPVNQLIKNAYLANGKYNVICLDWGALCRAPNYIGAVRNVPRAAERVSRLIDLLVREGLSDATRLHLIGHSLGAHVAGLAAAGAQARVSRVTGLDPALPLFQWTPEEHRLSKSDAELVDVIHTNAGWLGFSKALGTVDFYVNGGKRQPGCGLDLLGRCSHNRAYEYFAESIRKGKGFPSAYCTSVSRARNGKCNMMRTAKMGDSVQFSFPGSYYLTTA